MKTNTSYVNEDGIKTCVICVRPVDKPYRYQTEKGERGCVSECHDEFVRHNTKPGWCKPHYVLPKWITECRKAIKVLSLTY